MGFRMRKKAILTLMLVACAYNAQSVRADCKTDYDQAVDILNSVKQNALDGKHPSADVFSTDFQASVGKLQANQCMTELMSLLKLIQDEQKKYPPPAANTKPGLPIVD